MIEWISGKIYSLEPTKVIIDVGGIGYGINIPLSTYEKLKGKENCKLLTYFSIKNEKLQIVGFATEEEKIFFTELISIKEIGIQTAIRILSKMNFSEFKSAIINNDINIISSIKGVGNKRAKKILLELKEKYRKESFNELELEAIKGLISLGVKREEANKIVKKVKGNTTEELIKEALKKL